MEKTRAAALVKLLASLFPSASKSFDEASQQAYITYVCEKKNETAMYRAIRGLSETEKFLPSIAVLNEAYNLEVRKDQAALSSKTRQIEDKRYEGYGSAPPEWVHVWWWLRHTKNVWRSLPQQYPHAQDNPLSQAEYEAYRDEWRAAGAPTVTQQQVVQSATRG